MNGSIELPVSGREHGTYAGYQQHKRHGEQPCEACRVANRDRMRAYRRAGRDRWVNNKLGTCVRGLGWPR